jgi:hypothetical protein
MYTKFNKICFDIDTLIGWFTDTQTTWRLHKPSPGNKLKIRIYFIRCKASRYCLGGAQYNCRGLSCSSSCKSLSITWRGSGGALNTRPTVHGPSPCKSIMFSGAQTSGPQHISCFVSAWRGIAPSVCNAHAPVSVQPSLSRYIHIRMHICTWAHCYTALGCVAFLEPRLP